MINGVKYILILFIITLIVYLDKNREKYKEPFDKDCKRKKEPEKKPKSYEFLIKQMDITKDILDLDPVCMTQKKAGKFPDVNECVIL